MSYILHAHAHSTYTAFTKGKKLCHINISQHYYPIYNVDGTFKNPSSFAAFLFSCYHNRYFLHPCDLNMIQDSFLKGTLTTPLYLTKQNS